MDWLREFTLDRFLLLSLILARVSGLTMTAPVFGTKEVPMQVRGLLAVALSLLILPGQWHVGVEDPGSIMRYLVLVGGELLVGVSLGLGVMLLFGGIQLAGELVGRVSGIMLGNVFDPTTEAEVPTFSQMLLMVSLAVFVCLGGHRLVMAGLLDTFQAIPPGQMSPWQNPAFAAAEPGADTIQGSVVEVLSLLLTQSFSLGIRAAAPAVTAVLLATLVMGLISRTLPQLNILMVGFGVNSMLTYALLSITLGAAVWALQAEVPSWIGLLSEALTAPTRP